VPAVDSQAQRSANARIVERLSLVIGRNCTGDVPVALLNRDLVAQRPDELVAGRGGHAAKFDGGTVAADRLDAHHLLVGVNAGEAVEIGQSFMVIIGVLSTLDRLAGLIIDEFERAGAHDVLSYQRGSLSRIAFS